MFNGLQFIAALATVRAYWPPLIHSLLQYLTIWNFNIDLFRLECFVSLDYITKTTLYLAGPLLLILMLWGIYGIVIGCMVCKCVDCCGKACKLLPAELKRRAVLGKLRFQLQNDSLRLLTYTKFKKEHSLFYNFRISSCHCTFLVATYAFKLTMRPVSLLPQRITLQRIV